MRDQELENVAQIGKIESVQPILEVLCRITGMGFSAVARVTEDRWIACAVRDDIDFGLKVGGELSVGTTICNEIRQSNTPVIIDHVAEDEAFRDHPTPKMYGFQSYISIPIHLKDGSFFGTLCAIDPKPARINRPEIIEMFRLFAELISSHLDTQEQLVAKEAALAREQKVAELREQFIGVLGHDLRNPLASINSGINILNRQKPDAKAQSILVIMRQSVSHMAELISNVLDLTRGQLGDGLTLELQSTRNLHPTITEIIDQLKISWPKREILLDYSLDREVAVDTDRIHQMLSNLISNALTHGASDQPIRITAACSQTDFELSVANNGEPIPDEVRQRLFQPYYRSRKSGANQGIGLGLYIARQIARAHGGELEAASDQTETRFTFRMPLQS